MRGLSLGAFAVICLSAGLGFAQAATDSRPRVARTVAHPPRAADGSAYYIVRLKDAPAANYAGGVPGYPATDARRRSQAILGVDKAASYAAYLDARQSALLDSGTKLLGRALQARFRYHYALDGMSLRLTPTEAQRLGALPGVLSVQPVRFNRPVVDISVTTTTTTISSPADASDTNASRVWVSSPTLWQLPSNGTDNEGEGIVVADVDTGINHANISFAATGAIDTYAAHDPKGVRLGVCDSTNTAQHSLSTPLTCNDKLIGAYSYTHGSNDPHSPEDSEGHGSHTASTVAGDIVEVQVNDNATFISGVAPHASIIAYDVCDPTDLCGSDQTIAAVDQAIQDQATLKSKWGSAFKGMVLNYSIGGSNDSPYDDPVEMAFLNAVEAGIYVSVAGGNGGPENAVGGDPSSLYQVQHLGPWVATLAAATHDGTFTANDVGNFSLGDAITRPVAGAVITGAGDSSATPFGGALIVYAGSGDYDADEQVKSQAAKAPISGENYPASQGAAEDARQCLFPFKPGIFPFDIVPSNTIVVCDRGTIPLVDKAYNVQQGGAGGVIIATTSDPGVSQDMPIEPYVVPGTLIGVSDGNKLRTWLMASEGLTPAAGAAVFGSTLTTLSSGADQLAGFSSRGPNSNRFDSIVKPDLTAPGVNVLAAVGDPAYADGCGAGCSSAPQSFDFLDGTSMATPHDTGAAALLMQAHPSWTPSEIKSALMLTAVTAANGTSPGLTDQCASLDSGDNCVASTDLPSPQVRGAGRIDVDAANRSGLTLDESGVHYEAADPAKGGDLTGLNLASLGNVACAPSCSWSRTVQSTFSGATVDYSVSTSTLTSGLQVKVSPSSFTLAPHMTQVITVSVDSGGVPTGHWAFGEVDITTADTGDGGAAIPVMHMPLAVQATVPTALMALSISSLDYTVVAGKSAVDSFTIANAGLKPLSWRLAADGGAGTAGFSCAHGGGMKGLSFSQTSGTVPVDSSVTVTATLSAAALAAGDYSGVVCVSGNASDNPMLSLAVTAQVTGTGVSGNGGAAGGGGDMGLFGLTTLLLAWWRRKFS